jgi:hypothetical protein
MAEKLNAMIAVIGIDNIRFGSKAAVNKRSGKNKFNFVSAKNFRDLWRPALQG